MPKADLVTEILSQKEYLKCFTNNKRYFLICAFNMHSNIPKGTL